MLYVRRSENIEDALNVSHAGGSAVGAGVVMLVLNDTHNIYTNQTKSNVIYLYVHTYNNMQTNPMLVLTTHTITSPRVRTR